MNKPDPRYRGSQPSRWDGSLSDHICFLLAENCEGEAIHVSEMTTILLEAGVYVGGIDPIRTVSATCTRLRRDGYPLEHIAPGTWRWCQPVRVGEASGAEEPARESEERTMDRESMARRAKRRHSEALMALPDVVGVGLSSRGDRQTGYHLIVLYLERANPETALRAREIVGETPLETVVSGRIVAG
jgi:hypothetical protein